mmetsp:Transcript_60930/g.180391  ORF Transcript_60930/g.180391 Transcript_60930/m.180391 type:complete len:80 (-) Transcript_60930:409-648(-)
MGNKIQYDALQFVHIFGGLLKTSFHFFAPPSFFCCSSFFFITDLSEGDVDSSGNKRKDIIWMTQCCGFVSICLLGFDQL